MLPLLWLAFIAPPAAIDQAPVALPQPVVVQRVLAPPRCEPARCLSGEWNASAMAAIPGGQRRIDGHDLPGSGVRLLLADAQRRDWMKPQGSNARVGLQYGVEAETPPGTQLRVAFDTGFRLQAYADDGIAGTGPVLRGQLEWQQALGERTRLSQTTRVETGQHGTFLRNSLQVKLALQPGLVLSSGVEVRRDSDVAGRNQTDATLHLRYAF